MVKEKHHLEGEMTNQLLLGPVISSVIGLNEEMSKLRLSLIRKLLGPDSVVDV